MLNFSKTKIIATLLTCFLAFILLIPSFVNQEKYPLLDKILPNNKINLGLDLQGGSQLLLEVDFEYYHQEQIKNLEEEIRNSFSEEALRFIYNKIDNKLIFEISDESQKNKAKKIILKLDNQIEIEEDSGKIIVYFSEKELAKKRQDLVKRSIEIIRRRVDESGTKEPIIQAQGDNRILLQIPGVEDSSEIKNLLGKTAKLTFHFVSDQIFSGTQSQVINPNLTAASDSEGRVFLVEKNAILTGDMLVDANPTFHQGAPAVAFRFNKAGSQKFAKITSENIGRILAIVLDGKIVTAPKINSAITQGSGVISGNFTTKEAGDTALLLRAGALLAPLKIIEERSVGPSLGRDSIIDGAYASIAALVLISITMLLFYGFFGVITNIALIVNLALILAILSLIGATLTLPGIAGIILTMSMSVDANVLIFERIKEELREKKSIFASLESGFSQAFRTIFDSNITTLIVALFLFIFGNGPVRGFAVILTIGVASSMFCAIILTRLLISIWVKKTKPQKLGIA